MMYKRTRLEAIKKRLEVLEQDIVAFCKAKKGNPNHDAKGRFSSGTSTSSPKAKSRSTSTSIQPKEKDTSGNPMKDPKIYGIVRDHIESYVSSYKGDWERYKEENLEDGIDNILLGLPQHIQDHFDRDEERTGRHPPAAFEREVQQTERKHFGGKAIADYY